MKADKMARLLPEIFQATTGVEGPLDAFLAAQEQLHEQCETAIARFPEQLDPRTATPPFVYLLACWADLECLLDGPPHAPRFAAGVGRLRELVATAARNGRERGTERTLIRLLETATGCAGFAVEQDRDTPFHFRMTAPKEARAYARLVKRLLEAEKPAFATCELRFAPTEPTDDDGQPDAA